MQALKRLVKPKNRGKPTPSNGDPGEAGRGGISPAESQSRGKNEPSWQKRFVEQCLLKDPPHNLHTASTDDSLESFECATRHISHDFTSPAALPLLLPTSFALDDTDNEASGRTTGRRGTLDTSPRHQQHRELATGNVLVKPDAAMLTNADRLLNHSAIDTPLESAIPPPKAPPKAWRASLPPPMCFLRSRSGSKTALPSRASGQTSKQSLTVTKISKDAKLDSGSTKESDIASLTACNSPAFFSPLSHTLLSCPFRSVAEVVQQDRPTLVACRGKPCDLLNAAASYLTSLAHQGRTFDAAMIRRHPYLTKFESLIFVDYNPVHVKMTLFESPISGPDGCAVETENGDTPPCSECFWMELCRFSGDGILFWQIWQDLMRNVVYTFNPQSLSASWKNQSQPIEARTRPRYPSVSGKPLEDARSPCSPSRNSASSRDNDGCSRASTQLIKPGITARSHTFDLHAIDALMLGELNVSDGDKNGEKANRDSEDAPPLPPCLVHLESPWASDREEGASYVAQLSTQSHHRDRLSTPESIAKIKGAMTAAERNASMLYPLTIAIRNIFGCSTPNCVDSEVLEVILKIVEDPLTYCKWARRGGCSSAGDGGCSVAEPSGNGHDKGEGFSREKVPESRCLDASPGDDCMELAFPPLVPREAAAAVRDILKSPSLYGSEAFAAIAQRLERSVAAAKEASLRAAVGGERAATRVGASQQQQQQSTRRFLGRSFTRDKSDTPNSSSGSRPPSPDTEDRLWGDSTFISALEEAWMDCVYAGGGDDAARP